MRHLKYFLLLNSLLSLSTAFAQTWTQPADLTRGTLRFATDGTLGYSIRTHTGGGWAWQFVDYDNNAYFHVDHPTGKVGVGTTTPRGKFDVDGPGDIYLSDDVNTGTGQNLFLPGHIYLSPHAGSNVSYLQARRHNDSGSTALRIRTFNNGVISEALHVAPNGYVGIANTNPQHALDVGGPLNITGDILQLMKGGSSSGIQFHSGTNNSSIQFIKYGTRHAGMVFTGNEIVFKGMSSGEDHNPDVTSGNTEPVNVLFHGNVGIGISPGENKFAVDGNVRCEEVKVEIIPGTGPDYVFEPDYDLKPLTEVESYIKANKHLPEVPSAKEMEEEGLNLKEMNLILLRKVEELTLHLIEQQKEIAELRERSVSPDPSGKKVEELTLHLIELEKLNMKQSNLIDLQNQRITQLESITKKK